MLNMMKIVKTAFAHNEAVTSTMAELKVSSVIYEKNKKAKKFSLLFYSLSLQSL